MDKYRISFKNVYVWLADQLTHPKTLFQRKTWGVFSVYAHVRRSDRQPKAASGTKEKAYETAAFMTTKYGGNYSVYKCVYCNGWHLAKEGQTACKVVDTKEVAKETARCFYGADKELSAPEIHGYKMTDGHDVDKIMRVVNNFYKISTQIYGNPPFPVETLTQRKRIITERARQA